MGLKHQAVSARKWHAAIRQVERHFPDHLPAALFLTDPARVADPAQVVRTLPAGSGMIYRHFGAADRQEVAAELGALCRQYQIDFLIAADPALARQVSADGVHWPEARLPDARKWRGRFKLQTASAHSLLAVRRARRAGMDAVLCSTVFASKSATASSPLGVHRFRALANRADMPVYALGGVAADNASRVASVSGLAAIDGLRLK